VSASIQPGNPAAELLRPPVLAEAVPLGRPSLLWLQPGLPRSFGTEDIGSGGLVSGWAAPEPGHTWNDGIDATLRIALRRADQPLSLTLAAEPFVTRQNPTQDVTIYANGARAGFWRLTERHVTQMVAWIDPIWWRLQDGGSVLRIVVHLPQSVSPAELGSGEDVRQLGLSCRSILLTPAAES
jgi:hypothetical protein